MSGKPYKKRAFSMMELAVVVIIIGALSAVTMPVFSGAIVRHRVEAAARRVAADLMWARTRSMQTDSTQAVIFDKARNYYYIENMPDPLKPNGAHVVMLHYEPYEVRLAHVDFTASTDTPGDSKVIFNIYGQSDSGGHVVIESGDYRWWVTLDADTGKTTVSRLRPATAPVVPDVTLPAVVKDNVLPTVDENAPSQQTFDLS